MMRVALCAFFPDAFANAAESAHLTHGHPTGYQAAGLFADILARIWKEGLPLAEAICASLAAHGDKPAWRKPAVSSSRCSGCTRKVCDQRRGASSSSAAVGLPRRRWPSACGVRLRRNVWSRASSVSRPEHQPNWAMALSIASLPRYWPQHLPGE